MKETNQSKEYKTPQFQLVRQDAQNNVFFAASTDPQPKSPGATLSDVNNW